MKHKYLLFLIASFCLSILPSCEGDEYSLQNIIPENYHKIIYIKDSGVKDVTVYNTGTDEKSYYHFSVIKGGSDPSLEAHVNIGILTEEELTERSILEGVNYKMLSSEAYEMPSSLDFQSMETFKEVELSLNPLVINNEQENNPNSVLVLPICLESVGDSVNVQMSEIFMKVTIQNASIGFSVDGTGLVEVPYGSLVPNMEYNALVKLDVENKWDISCDFEIADQSYVDSYNAANRSSYELLTEDYCTFSERLELHSGTTESYLKITIDGEAVKNLLDDEMSGDFILPVRMKDVNMFEISSTNSVYNILLHINAKLDRSSWTVESSCEELLGSKPDREGAAKCMLDDDTTTFWETIWKSEEGGITGNPPPYTNIIDTKSEHVYYKFVLLQRQGIDSSGQPTKDFSIEVSNSKDGGWVKLIESVLLNTGAQQEFVVPQEFMQAGTNKGRYIRFIVNSVYRSDKPASLSEFYVYGE